MPSVLVVSYLFPPAGGIGVSRGLAYARYLPDLGCRTFILAPRWPATPVYDRLLLKEIPERTTVIRAFNPELPFDLRDKIWSQFSASHRNAGSQSMSGVYPPRAEIDWKRPARRWVQKLFFPDVQRVWNPFAIDKASHLIEREHIDAVILNLGPFSQLQIGIELKRRYPEVKLICDFRDDWTGYYLHSFDSPSEEKVQSAKNLELNAVSVSDFVSTVTSDWQRAFQQRYPDQPPDKFILTPNGYDPALFSRFQSRPRKGGRMIVTYLGTLHNNRIYSPVSYLDAIERLPPQVRSNIETHFVGRVTSEAQLLLQNRDAILRQLGFLPKIEAIRKLEEADILLLIATDPGSHAGKLFDYLATGKPILALSPPEGEIGTLLRRTGAGFCIDPWNVDAISATLLSLYERFQSPISMTKPNWEEIQRYSWPAIFARFVEEIGLTATGRVPSQTNEICELGDTVK